MFCLSQDCCLTKTYDGKKEQDLRQLARPCELTGRNPAVFQSTEYPCVYRETVVHKDDRARYIDPFKDVITTPSGRRLMYDSSHPDMIFGSQWSSELADPPGPYSFPVTTELEPEIPWTKEMQWQVGRLAALIVPMTEVQIHCARYLDRHVDLIA